MIYFSKMQNTAKKPTTTKEANSDNNNNNAYTKFLQIISFQVICCYNRNEMGVNNNISPK